MKININDIGGALVKEDDRYVVKDNNDLKNLVVSSTDPVSYTHLTLPTKA